MASIFFSVLSIITLAGSSWAGLATFSHSPFSRYHAVSAPANAITYSSRVPVYHQQQPLVYQQAPVAIHKSVAATAPLAYYATPQQFIKSAVHTPILTRSLVAAPAPVQPVLARTFAAPVSTPLLKQVEFESSPRYDFSYGVHDSISGDIKSQVESRDGGNVQGAYSVVDADGYKRTVTYTADDLNGFNAVVHREPILAKTVAVPVAAPVVAARVVAAPVTRLQHVSPVQHVTPVQHVSPVQHVTPVQHIAPLQQHLQYLPQASQVVVGQQQPQHLFAHQEQFGLQHQYVPQVVEPSQEGPEQAEEQQNAAEQQQEQEQPQEQQEPQQQQQFPQQYPQYEQPQNIDTQEEEEEQQSNDGPSNDDSDVVELRSASGKIEAQDEQDSKQESQQSQSDKQLPSSTTVMSIPLTGEEQPAKSK